MDETPYLGAAVARLDEGIVALNMSLTPVAANPSARVLLGLQGAELPPDLPLVELRSVARRAFAERQEIQALLRDAPGERSIHVRAVALKEPEGVLLFLRDVTDEHRTQQLRRQFVAHASHELKTPVASLTALTDAIERSLDDDIEATRRFTARLSTEARRLSALIDDLMDLSRVEDPAALHAHSADLSEIARIQVKEIATSAQAKDIRVKSEINDGIAVHGDDQHLELMIRNLLDNAVRYTGEGGHIALQLHASNGNAYLAVSDDGIGIPLAAQARVFERFFRVDEDRARTSGGTGLGLSIVKNVAESHGGSVSVTSELDEGSTFEVVLPLARSPGAE